VPNPAGSNQFYVPEPAYGDVKKLQQLQGSAPMSGAPTPAVTAPERAQYKATTPPQASVSPSKPSKASGGMPDYRVEVAGKWGYAASIPGASEIVKRMAMRAAKHGA
jgi:hypothetical protein